MKSVGRAKLRAPEWVTEATKLESSSKVLSRCQILSQRTVWISVPEEAHCSSQARSGADGIPRNEI